MEEKRKADIYTQAELLLSTPMEEVQAEKERIKR
jgi:hypothetical protein